ELELLFASRSRAAWSELFTRLDFPGEAVLSAAEALAHPQALTRDVARQDKDGLVRFDYPARFDGERPSSAGTHVPALGADTAKVLAEWGRQEATARPSAQRRSGIGARSGFWHRIWSALTG
ncbi:MAG: CoA transferase, partial [Acidobacteriota bacterium]